MSRSRARDMSSDALMRWEWEGGTPDSVRDATRTQAVETSDIRSQATNSGRQAHRDEVDHVDDSAEPGPPHV